MEGNSLSPSLPDSSIIFKLLKEQTNKKVDLNTLYDVSVCIYKAVQAVHDSFFCVFQSFLAIVENEEPVVPAGKRRASVKVQVVKAVDEDACL